MRDMKGVHRWKLARGLRDEGHLPAHLRWLGPGCAHRRVTVGALDWQLPGGRPEPLAPVQTAAPQVLDERGVQQAQSKQTGLTEGLRPCTLAMYLAG